MSQSIRATLEIDIGFAVGLAILWLRPLGLEKSQDIPTAMLALAAFMAVSLLAVVLVERRLPIMRSRRDPTKKRQVKKDRQVAGFVVGLVTLFAAEVATGFDGPANFAMMLGLAATVSYWYATETFGPIKM